MSVKILSLKSALKRVSAPGGQGGRADRWGGPGRMPAKKAAPALAKETVCEHGVLRGPGGRRTRGDPPKGRALRAEQNGLALESTSAHATGEWVAAEAPLDEEVFRWKPQMKGVWVEIGVTGIDFELIGNPVREMWLPRDGASERAYFPVIPTGKEGISRLRVCLEIQRADVVQPFPVAAVTQEAGAKVSAAGARKKLSASLGIRPSEGRRGGLHGAVEYSTSSPAETPRP